MRQQFALLNKKKQMELDELEENNRKRLVEATLQEFELLDAVSKGSLQVLGAQ